MVSETPRRLEERKRATELLLGDLVADAHEVRLVPRLRVVIALAIVIAAIAAALFVRSWGLRPDLVFRLTGDPSFAAIWLGLLLMGFGALLAAAAASIPGRVRAERVGFRLAALGAAIGLVAAPLWVLLMSGGAGLPFDWHAFVCMGGAARIAALPAVGITAFVLWALPARPAFAACLGCVGLAALGAAVVHAACPDDNARHWVAAHALAPLFVGLVVGLPLFVLARARSARRLAKP